MFDAVVGRVLKAWLESKARAALTTSQPRGILQVHATGPNADRVLLVLDRPSVGDGILSQELGLAGHVARQLSTRSLRGTDIDILANGNMTARECAVALAAIDLSRFDSIILMIGSSEALALSSPRHWARSLNELLDGIAAKTPHRAHTFVVQVPPVAALIDFPRVFEVAVGARIAKLNAATVEACARRAGVSVIPFGLPAAASSGRNSSHTFALWAAFIAPIVGGWLDRSTGIDRADEVANESSRQNALDDLHIIDSSPDPRIDRIVVSARNLLGTPAAAVTFLDHDRRWVKSAVGTTVMDSPRLGSLCDLAINQPGVFLIEDLATSQYRADDVARDDGVVFYAGYPIESPRGRRIGVLCVMDFHARRFSRSDESLLRQMALQIQAELWN